MADWKVPGAAIAVIKEDQVMVQGFGYRDVEQQLPVTPEMLFAIGSATKPFTTTAIGILVDKGKLDWDRPVRKWLPELKMFDPVATERLTLRDMACHRSGLPRYDVMLASSFSRKELIERLQYLEPNQDFRAKFQYQNLMYIAAGYLLGKVADTSWEAFVEEYLFAPLEMKTSNFLVDEMQTLSDYALPYGEQKEF